jgi:hypothetical protein
MAEAVTVAGIEVTPETQAHLMDALRPVVAAAYHQAALTDMASLAARARAGTRWRSLGRGFLTCLTTCLRHLNPQRRLPLSSH